MMPTPPGAPPGGPALVSGADGTEIVKRPPPVLPANIKKKRADDLTCQRCGEINTANRKFCARCGQPIEGVSEPTKKKKSGSNPLAGMGARAMLITRIVPVIVVGLTLLYAAVPSARDWMNERKDSVIHVFDPKTVSSVTPPSPQATTEADGHPATAVVDLNPTTYWLSSPDDPQPSLTFSFGVPVRLKEMILRNGALNENSDYRFFRRAKDVVITLQFADGKQKQFGATFADSSIATISGVKVIDGQHVDLKNSGLVAKMQIVVASTYAAPAGSPLAVTEIEFFSEKG
jgi:hypothetical protein